MQQNLYLDRQTEHQYKIQIQEIIQILFWIIATLINKEFLIMQSLMNELLTFL